MCVIRKNGNETKEKKNWIVAVSRGLLKQRKLGFKRKKRNLFTGPWILGHGLGSGEMKGPRKWALKKKKTKRGRIGKSGKEGDLRDCGEFFLPLELWPTIWTTERRPFRLKFWGGVLLDERNDSTVADRDFNDRILRSVVREPNPKTLIKCVFP